jgi:selenocysteine lyase/cysteine desulfurase
MWDFYAYDQPLAQDASRFEGGTPNFIGALSLASSIDVFESAGTDRIASHVLSLTDRLVEGLLRIGCSVQSMRGENCSSGIVTFSADGSDSIALGQALQREGIITTYRANGVRVAPHGYNTEAEIDRLVEAVAACKKEDLCSR